MKVPLVHRMRLFTYLESLWEDTSPSGHASRWLTSTSHLDIPICSNSNYFGINSTGQASSKEIDVTKLSI